MMAAIIDRKALKASARTLVKTAQVSPKAMTALYLALVLVLSLADGAAGGSPLYGGSLPGTFVSVLTSLASVVLFAGFILYCMAIRRGERAEFLTLFDGFSFVGKIIGLYVVMFFFIALWSMLFFFPGIIAFYRYRFAVLNLCENPSLGVFEALEMSKRQTMGYKSQLFLLDLSYVGWSFLASIPTFLLQWSFSYQMLENSFSVTLPGSSAMSAVMAASPTVWILFIGLWSLVVSLFYLPAYQCTELGYFEIAKSTSGVSSDAKPDDNAGPDGLGGL